MDDTPPLHDDAPLTPAAGSPDPVMPGEPPPVPAAEPPQSATPPRRRGGPLGLVLGSRTRKQVTLAAVAAVALTAVGLALIVPRARTTTIVDPQATQHVTSSDSGAVADGSGNIDVTKSYPRLYSSKLGIDVAILPGDGKTPPVKPIAYQYPKTAPLGQTGNTYLYAHDRPGMFFGLHAAKVGDVLTVATSPTAKLYFQITEIHANVAWNDLQWLQPSTDERLTLQTCNFSGDFDPRYIVVTKPISGAQGQALTGGT